MKYFVKQALTSKTLYSAAQKELTKEMKLRGPGKMNLSRFESFVNAGNVARTKEINTYFEPLHKTMKSLGK